MKTNAQAEYPEPQEISCTKCLKEIGTCDGCKCVDFEDGDEILCYKNKHYCEDCAEELKQQVGK